MNGSVKVLIAAGLLAAGAASRASGGEDGPPRLTGGFIQIQGWMFELTPEDWDRELDAMRHVGLDTLIIQYLQYNDTNLIPTDPTATDPTREILRYADVHKMRVFIGTKADDGWWKWDEAYLKKSLAERKALTTMMQERYGEHRSFGGWYFTEEASGFLTPEKVVQLRGYFRELSDHCKALRDQPVGFAPFFSDITPLEDMRRIYSGLLDGAGIDIMMVQDGVGARGWDEKLEEKIVPFFQMYQEICKKTGVTLWCDLESFEREDMKKEYGFIATEIERVVRQLKAVDPYVEKFVTFDFFHYMSPYRGERQRALYEGYCRYLGIEPKIEAGKAASVRDDG